MKRNLQKDLAKLAKAFFANLQFSENGEYGYIGLDDKRPFGNSQVEIDILDIIGAKMEGWDEGEAQWTDEQIEYARDLYVVKLAPYLYKKYGNKK